MMDNKKEDRLQKNKEIVEWVKAISIAVIVAVLVRAFVFEMVVVEQSSMYPTLKEGDKLCVIKIAYLVSEPERGDIAIVRISNNTNYVKRVIGLSGETIEIKDNTVYIDGNALQEDYLEGDLQYADFDAVRIPDNCYFVMGDNRPYSMDSRSEGIGFIHEDDISGKVLFKTRPFTWYK